MLRFDHPLGTPAVVLRNATASHIPLHR